jgi:ribosomal protein L33
LKSLNKRFPPRRKDYLDTGKDKTSIIKISCLEQTVRNFITVFGRHPNVKNAPGKKEVENFCTEIYGKKVVQNEEA